MKKSLKWVRCAIVIFICPTILSIGLFASLYKSYALPMFTVHQFEYIDTQLSVIPSKDACSIYEDRPEKLVHCFNKIEDITNWRQSDEFNGYISELRMFIANKESISYSDSFYVNKLLLKLLHGENSALASDLQLASEIDKLDILKQKDDTRIIYIIAIYWVFLFIYLAHIEFWKKS